MARRALPAMFALAALVADLSGQHGFALVVLFAAIPAGFALTLDCYGDLLQARCRLTRPLAAGAALVLLVLSATLRSPAVVGGVPRMAVSAIVLCLLLYTSLAVGVLLVAARRPQARAVVRSEETPEPERLAA